MANTLDRLLSKAGVGSRTEARRWVAERRVTVNGRVVTNPELWIDPQRTRLS
jgi:16S rRNA U516 pseudouridylate synthase RsuA-like enzyme